MEAKTGYLYFLKDNFFSKVNDPYLKIDHKTTQRPHYLAVKDMYSELNWLVPCSSQIEKFEKLIKKKKEQKKSTDGIIIVNIQGQKSALLFQDMFPITDDYISMPYIRKGVEVSIEDKKVLVNLEKTAKKIIKLLHRGIKFTPTQPDVQRIEKIMLEEIQQQQFDSNVAKEVEQSMITPKPEKVGHIDPIGTVRTEKSKKKEINDSAHSTKNKSILDRIKTEK